MTVTPVLVLLDHAPDGSLRPPVRELLTLARGVAGEAGVHGVWAGDEDLDAALPVLAAQGVSTVHRLVTAADVHLSAVLADGLEAALGASGASLLLLVSSFDNKEAAARLAVRTGAGVVTDADGLTVEDGAVVAHKTVLAGTWTTRCAVSAPSAIVTVKANAVPAQDAASPSSPQVVDLPVEVRAGSTRVRLVERTEHAASGRPDLGSANVVVVGGRGTEGDFTAVEELADVLGGAVGATRVATDEGWIGHDAQIGQTGVTVSPRLYVGAGVSGAVHHRGGMQASGTIVAVNSDPDAPIFEIADFGIVGDLFTVLPQAAAELRRLQG
ncbi:electron transfer flavoprotein subunit alpha/FixB family protein [Cellulomonas xiejunii]|uniref:Electron transfer flavoprotein subunit alpha/FixB family protein n=1 Tax=Cellulomonas xiejunii TaxID=2968083 RepID=A0ABY5KT32_9CELL|nr:electron transfer flavoprotein subunit alpha/FixB family protein [Cellulomonas xiejunii]MCC2315242.1 electron transfer flavoprotein subunit alpha/FixB family protein [Cellulomonas xiejunii]MCC2321615.1 electron transfer flavoprotein subunit alpha/FixB family protein [Cellulomonas xiejunii]UUI72930.1 electron transfer flavoprotein subunit alpha/FixB family protein [Cellulomonas xiejunii]